MILSDQTIREELATGRIGIEPLDEGCIQPSSVDLHVDRYFRVFRNHNLRAIDVKEDQEELTELVTVAEDDVLMLHPGEFVLGSTVERVRLPDDLVGRLEGKSSLGRLGLLIHSTAGFVDAGWDGHLTLELSNVANLPITLYPGMKIGQISFLKMTTPADTPVRVGRARLQVPAPAGARRPAGTSRTSATASPERREGLVLTRYPIGLAATAVALVDRGLPPASPLRLARVRQAGAGPHRTASSRRAEVELEEVVGQRRLLKWTVPGLAHAFTFWGFTVLILTIIEAYGDLFKENFAIPGIGHLAFIGFIEDFFACAVLVALCIFSVIRLRSSPKRKERASRFYGSHTATAWVTLAMIALVIITLLVYRAAQTNTGDFPYGWWAFASHGIGKRSTGSRASTNRTIETVFVDLNIVVIMSFLVLVVYSKHLHIFMAPLNVAFTRQPSRLGALDKTPEIDIETMDEDTIFGAGRIDHFTWKQLLDLVTCTECGRCQSQCPAWNTGKALSPKLVVMDLREELFGTPNRPSCRTSSPRTCSGRARPAGRVSSSARSTSSTSTPSSTCAATRC